MPLNTLRGRANFQRVLGGGQARRSNGVVLHWAMNGFDFNRYACAAKLSVGNAVVRNRVRRWTRELFRRWDPEIAPGYDLVVIARDPSVADDYSQYSSHLANVLRKAELCENVS